jgi:predicted TIM-barrel fold metal-dependent hydrolase
MHGIVDADTHLFEPQEVWDFFDKALYPRRPIVLTGPKDTVYRKSRFWLIDGNIFPRSAGKGGFLLGTPTEPEMLGGPPMPDMRARELLDIEGRLQAMDQMGVDVQVVYPTLFLAYITDDVNLEIALCHAYNRFMAEVWKKAQGRLRWLVVPPLRSVDASLEEINFGKEHGAVGLFFRGIERDRTLDDPYFFPVYAEAARLDLPICVHTGAGCPAFTAVFDVTRSHTFPHTRTLPLMAFRNLVANKIPELFPTIRFGFIEGGASWVPYVLHALRSVYGGETSQWGPGLFRDYRLFVTYEEWEDLPYLLKYTGEDNGIVGSDWGHHGGRGRGGDPSGQPEVFSNMKAREDVSGRTIEKMLVENPRRFYGLP